MNKQIILTLVIFIAIIGAISIPNIIPVLGISGNSIQFNVSLTISNSPPTITFVPNGQTDTPLEATTKITQITFNASDSNGISDIPAANAKVIINQSVVTLTSSACVVLSSSGNLNDYQCNVTINYYNLPGTWTINASVFDSASQSATNMTQSFTMGTLTAIQLKTNQMTFSGNPGDANVAASNNPQLVNNTGNAAFGQINLTAYSLQSGSNYIGAGNFTANTSNTGGPGQMLSNNTPVTLTNSSLAVQGTKNIYLYLNIPSSIQNGTYNSVSSWVATLT